MNSVNKTSLYNNHVELKAKILPFAGYMMPINYPKGIQFEYDCVRNETYVFTIFFINLNSDFSIIFVNFSTKFKFISPHASNRT